MLKPGRFLPMPLLTARLAHGSPAAIASTSFCAKATPNWGWGRLTQVTETPAFLNWYLANISEVDPLVAPILFPCSSCSDWIDLATTKPEPPRTVPATIMTGTPLVNRSEERRVGKECRSRWSPY